jgi:ABC-type nickel/cobalt efflux system permease component RcnA
MSVALVDLEPLYRPAEELDGALESMLDGGGILVVVVVALLLGLRHASDPDHLVAVTSLAAGDGGKAGDAARLGACWGIGHAAALVALGLPLILLGAQLPSWLERGAEKAIAAVIVILGARVVWRWLRGGFRASTHRHSPAGEHRHLWRERSHRHPRRTPRQAVAIGALHGLAGTGAVVLLLLAALPGTAEAVLALAVFAPASVASMTACTAAFTWALTRPRIEPAYRRVLLPVLGAGAIVFGIAFAGAA